jgi:hypothetical protein
MVGIAPGRLALSEPDTASLSKIARSGSDQIRFKKIRKRHRRSISICTHIWPVARSLAFAHFAGSIAILVGAPGAIHFAEFTVARP